MIDYLSKFKLDGKVAVVTGGVGLLGTEVSTALAQAGAKTIIADRNETKAKKLEERLRAKGLKIEYIHFDIPVV